MKKTPLRRKTPLKRTGLIKRQNKPQRSRGLRPVSKAREPILAEYKALKGSSDKHCVCCGKLAGTEPHHPYGRGGQWVLVFYYICGSLHHWIHHVNPNKAKELGWLQPEYRGTIRHGDEPEPWLMEIDPEYCTQLTEP